MRHAKSAIHATAICLALLTVCTAGAESPLSDADVKLFESKVRPILVEHCYQCHSADAKKLRGNLHLDSKAGWQRGGDSGPAVIPGDAKKSLLLKAIRYQDPDLQMPPKGKLPREAIAALENWVLKGAPDPRTGEAGSPAVPARRSRIDLERGRQFWSFRPVVDHPTPTVRAKTWPRSPIDRFILARLEDKQLKPTADADRRTLIRRVYFDLIGLPPTPAQIKAFLNDPLPTPRAFEKVVDQLLASPRFGERWGRHWLDVARFAESSGGGRTLLFDKAWRYRDYVIDSFNRDRPYDQFIRQQIAGDLLPYSSVSERADNVTAVGYLTLGPTNYELQDKALLRMEVVDEQIDTVGRTFLAMTLGCARCHDHPFDPVPTTDYYALAGIFRSTKTLTPGNVSGYETQELPLSPAQRAALDAHNAKVKALESRIKQAKTAIAKLDPKAPNPKAGKPKTRIVTNPNELGGVVVDDVTAVLTGTWTKSTFHKVYVGAGYQHASRDASANFRVAIPNPGRYDVRLAYSPGTNRSSKTRVTVKHADGTATRTVNQKRAGPIDGLFVSLGTYRFVPGTQAIVTITTDGADGVVIVDAVQLLPASDDDSEDKAAGEPTVAKAQTPPDGAAKQQLKEDRKQQLDALHKRVSLLEGELLTIKKDGPTPPARVMAVRDEAKPEDWHVNIRGNIRNLGPKVPRGFLTVAWHKDEPPKIAPGQSGRVELADWIASRDNPLTARVMANRVWHHLFGHGLVRTTDNFGEPGQRPSHPELLDHLAARFVEDGWSVKSLIRRIVTSRTYQLDSSPTSDAARLDPENRLLSHQHRRRLDAEAIHDALLAVSGQLDLTVGGKTMRKVGSSFNYRFDVGRRAVYHPSFRNTLHPLLEVFDFADPNLVVGNRPTSTLPTQALFMLNSPLVMGQAERAAKRFTADPSFAGMSTPQRIDLAFERALGRTATPRERDLTQRQLASFASDASAEAWTSVFHALFASVDFRHVR